MNFALTAEQVQLQLTVRDFLASRSTEADVRHLMETESGYDDKVWSEMARDLGLQALGIPEQFGGVGAAAVELSVVFEEMGRALYCGPFLSTVALAGNCLSASDDAEAQARYLPALVAGELIATVALCEENGRWDGRDVATVASRSSDGCYRLDGVKCYVLDGAIADLILVVARLDVGLSLFAVEGAATGLTRTPMQTLDATRKQARLEFRDVPGRLVGARGRGWPSLSWALRIAEVCLAAEQVGGAERAMQMSVDYAKIRQQFGRPIGSFQAVQHKCADMLVAVEAARAAAQYAAWVASAGDSELPAATALAKAFCSEVYSSVTAEAVQVHGGIGFTWEHPLHLYLKRAKSTEYLFGDPDYHRDLLAGYLGLAGTGGLAGAGSGAPGRDAWAV